MPRFALAAAGAGLLSAVLYGAILTGSVGAMFLAYLAQLPLFLIGLWLGASGVAIAGGVALAAVALLGGVFLALLYCIIDVAPALALTYLMQLNRMRDDGKREFLPLGPMVAALVAGAALVFLTVWLFWAGEPGGLEGAMRQLVDDRLRAVFEEVGVRPGTVNSLSVAMPAVMAIWWIALTVGNAALAHALLRRTGRNFRAWPKMADLELPQWLMGALAIALLGGVMPGVAGFVGANLTLIFVLAYTLAGLGVSVMFIAMLKLNAA